MTPTTAAGTEPAMEAAVASETMRFAKAINHTLARLLEQAERVFLLGEDIVDAVGGAMQVTRGLSTRFGRERVRETPISEQAIMGAALGGDLARRGATAGALIL